MTDSQTAYRIFASGTDMGTYWGLTRREAEDAYAQDAGYGSFDELRR